MARRRRSRSRSNTQVQREASVFTSGLETLLDLAPIPRSGRALLDVEDRRSFHPESVFRAARSPRRTSHQLVIKRRLDRPRVLPWGVSFRGPESVLVCVRRGRRREVLFAKRLRGKGSAARNRKRSYYSSISCRR